MAKNATLALYKLVKTTQDNIIIRRDGTNQIAVLLHNNHTLLKKNQIENIGLCIKLSHKIRPSRYIAGTFQRAVEAAKLLLEDK